MLSAEGTFPEAALAVNTDAEMKELALGSALEPASYDQILAGFSDQSTETLHGHLFCKDINLLLRTAPESRLCLLPAVAITMLNYMIII